MGNNIKSHRWKHGVSKFIRNRTACFGSVIILIFILSAVFAPWLFSGDPNALNLIHSLERPSLEHLLGTDQLGRDILGRILYGGRVSLTIAFGAVALGLLFGLPLGLVSGYFGGKTDFIIQRLTDIMLSFPPFILALSLVAVLGVGLKNTLISVGIAGIPHIIRIIRGSVLSIREQVYVEAARAVGTPDVIILVRHILPNVMVPLIVNCSLFLGM